MTSQRTMVYVWMVLGCIVFCAVGFQLATKAWAKSTNNEATTVRGQSPDDDPNVDPSDGREPVDADTSAASPTNSLMLLLAVFVLAIFVGFEIITKVPPTLHTPLMSGSNAISGITLVGAMIVAGAGWGFSSLLGMLAVALAMINVVGGFLVTHRMLSMFQAKKK